MAYSKAKLPKDVLAVYAKIFGDKEIPTVTLGKPKVGNNIPIATSGYMRLGFIVNFVYLPKWKDELPYYDALPLSVVLYVAGDRFLGINLHYVPWTKRIRLAEILMKSTKNKKRLRYGDILKAWQKAQLPLALAYMCLRWYLFDHVKSQVKMFGWDTYRAIVVNLRPKFRKGPTEKEIQAILMARFIKHKVNHGLKETWK